jgi:ATP-dependent DNA helicase RecG
VGPKNAATLAKVGIRTVRDVLFYFPRRHEDRTKLPQMLAVRPGQRVTVRGRLLGLDSKVVRGGKVVLKAVISDGTSSISLT